MTTAPVFYLYKKTLDNIYENKNKQNVVVVGSGFACKSFQSTIDKQKFNVTIISPTVNPSDKTGRFINHPNFIGSLFGKSYESKLQFEKYVNVVQDSLKSVDTKEKNVKLVSGKEQKYDILVMAVGSVTNTFGIPGVEEYCLHLKSEDDIKIISEQIKNGKINESSEVAVLGGGILGVEISSAIKTKTGSTSIFEMANSILPIKGFEKCQQPIMSHLFSQNISVNLMSKVNNITKKSDGKLALTLSTGESLLFDTIIYTCGVKPNPIMKNQLNFKTVTGNFKVVDTNENIVNDVYAIGDCNGLVPMSAQNAKNQGYHLAKLLNGTTKDDYVFESLGTLIRLNNSAYMNSQKYVGYVPHFVHDITAWLNM